MQEVTPATLPVALQEQSRCARAIFEFNRWRWAMSCNAHSLCERGQSVEHDYWLDRTEFMDGSPDRILQCCPAFGRASVKRCIQNNALFARLINKDNLKFESLQDASVEQRFKGCHAGWNSTLTNDDWNVLEDGTMTSGHHGGHGFDDSWSEFFENMFKYAEHDTSASNVLRAVYGERHGGLVDAFFQVALGFACLDTPVPQMFPVDPYSTDWEECHSGWEGEVVEYRPLQVWLQETVDWLGDPVVDLFHTAAAKATARRPAEAFGWPGGPLRGRT